MKPFAALVLTSTIALVACIAQDVDDMPEDAQVVTDDAQAPEDDADVRDARVPPPDGGPVRDQGRPVDAAPARMCAENADPQSCAAADCTWREDACVALADCADAENGSDCYNAGCSWAVDGCRAPDDPLRCADTETAEACTRRRCFWRRPAGEDASGCWPDRSPSIQDCAQPDPATCEAAGCEWTGLGCAPPNQTPCDELDEDACDARAECTQTPAGCAVDPDSPCDGLATDDCSTRVDCGVRGLACVDLPQDACPEVPQWVCEQRVDCQALRPDCNDAPKGGAGGQGGEGAGSFCDVRDDCGPAEGCVDGECLSCDTYLGCQSR